MTALQLLSLCSRVFVWLPGQSIPVFKSDFNIMCFQSLQWLQLHLQSLRLTDHLYRGTLNHLVSSVCSSCISCCSAHHSPSPEPQNPPPQPPIHCTTHSKAGKQPGKWWNLKSVKIGLKPGNRSTWESHKCSGTQWEQFINTETNLLAWNTMRAVEELSLCPG